MELKSPCHGATITLSLGDGVLIGSCAACNRYVCRVNLRTGDHEWLDGESPWTANALRPMKTDTPPAEARGAVDDGLSFIRFAAPAPAGTRNNRWRCWHCDQETTTDQHWPPLECPACHWVDGQWKWLGDTPPPADAGATGEGTG